MKKYILPAIIGAVATIISAIIGYWGTSRSVLITIQATQTAEARLTPSPVSLSPITTPQPLSPAQQESPGEMSVYFIGGLAMAIMVLIYTWLYTYLCLGRGCSSKIGLVLYSIPAIYYLYLFEKNPNPFKILDFHFSPISAAIFSTILLMLLGIFLATIEQSLLYNRALGIRAFMYGLYSLPISIGIAYAGWHQREIYPLISQIGIPSILLFWVLVVPIGKLWQYFRYRLP